MKTTKLFETETQRRENRLLNTLETINTAIFTEKLFPTFTPGAKHKNYCKLYDKEHAQAMVKKLCDNLNLRGNGEKIYVTDENSSFSFFITNTPVLLADLKKEISINRALKPIFSKSSPNKEYWLTMKPRELAEIFDSLEDFMNDQDHLNCRQNLQTAINGLQMLKQNNPGEKAQIKGLENMVKLWQSHCDVWDQVSEIAKNTDYTEIKAVNEDRRINDLVENNEAVKLLHPQIDNISTSYTSHRDIYELFKNAGLEPVNDINLYVSLKAAYDIQKEQVNVPTWNPDHSNVTGERWEQKYTSFDDYLKALQTELKEQTEAFNDKYRLKKTGMYKSVPHRERGYRDIQERKIERQNAWLGLVIKNEFQIKKLLQNE